MEQQDESTSHSSSAMEIGNHNDIFSEILLRSPAKTLIRFKSISRSCHALISDNRFCRMHTLRTPPEISLFLRASTSQFFYFNPATRTILPYNFPFSGHVDILQACNGLLLLQVSKSRNARFEYYIYNPTSRQSSKLLLMDSGKGSYVFGLSLAFDASKSLHYKVICVRNLEHSFYSYRIELYDSETQTWTICVQQFTAPSDVQFSDGIYLNDRVHWSRFTTEDFFCFDMDRTELQHLLMPIFPGVHSGICRQILHVFRGKMYCLLVLDKDVFSDQKDVMVLELQGDYSQWVLKHTTTYYEMNYTGGYSVLGFIPGESEEQSILLFHVPGKLIAYKFTDQCFEDLVDFRGIGSMQTPEATPMSFEWYNCYQFVETLAPI